MSFADGVKLLAGQTKHVIIADGSPLLAATDWDLHDSAKTVLDRFCEKFDYEWKVDSQGDILLRKRFNNPEELPQMHLSELQQVSRDVLRVLTAMPCDPDTKHTNAQHRALYDSLSPDQRSYLLAKSQALYGNPLQFEQLNPLQRSLVSEVIVSNAIGPCVTAWQRLNAALEALPQSFLHRDVVPGAAPMDPASPRFVFLEFNRGGLQRIPLQSPPFHLKEVTP